MSTASHQHKYQHSMPGVSGEHHNLWLCSQSNMTMFTPVGTRVSMRANKGQTSKNDDFVQQITLNPGTYASDSNNLYMLEDVGNTNSMRNIIKASRPTPPGSRRCPVTGL